jgi:hypothetical protein
VKHTIEAMARVKPVVAIVETEIGRHAAAVDAALREYRSTQEAFAIRRLALGRALVAARGCFPARGPKAKGWGDFLAARGIDQDVALEAMRYAGFVDEERVSRDLPGNYPTRRQAGLDGDDSDGYGVEPLDPNRRSAAPQFRQLSESELRQALARLDPDARKRVIRGDAANLAGGSGEEERGTWCTSAKWAEAVGAFDLDPFSNMRSKIASVERCMLEDGGDAFGGCAPGSSPGLYLVGDRHSGSPTSGQASEDTRVWIQPPYERVLDAIAHYGHTRFCALLRFSPDVEWFRRLWPLTTAVAIPLERMDFDPPPGVEKPKSSIPYPHALYYADERDITDAVRALSIIWRVDHTMRPPLQLVR